MGKSLIIKGADFSENGFSYKEVSERHNTLYDRINTVVTDISTVTLELGNYLYEHADTHILRSGSNLERHVATCYNNLTNFIDAEGWDVVEVTSIQTIVPQATVSGGLILGFLNENKVLIGGITNGKGKATITEGVDASNDIRTFVRNIPNDCKYIVAMHSGDISKFSLILKKIVIE